MAAARAMNTRVVRPLLDTVLMEMTIPGEPRGVGAWRWYMAPPA